VNELPFDQTVVGIESGRGDKKDGHAAKIGSTEEYELYQNLQEKVHDLEAIL
jgi:hypothetical protein